MKRKTFEKVDAVISFIAYGLICFGFMYISTKGTILVNDLYVLVLMSIGFMSIRGVILSVLKYYKE